MDATLRNGEGPRSAPDALIVNLLDMINRAAQARDLAAASDAGVVVEEIKLAQHHLERALLVAGGVPLEPRRPLSVVQGGRRDG